MKYPDSRVIRSALMWLLESSECWADLKRVSEIAISVQMREKSMKEEYLHLFGEPEKGLSEAGAQLNASKGEG